MLPILPSAVLVINRVAQNFALSGLATNGGALVQQNLKTTIDVVGEGDDAEGDRGLAGGPDGG